MNLTDLTDNIFSDVASYLPAPSRALLAVALAASFSSETVLSLFSSEAWDVLDFGDVEKYLARKLTDDDMSALLMCIGAADNLKVLRLPGCFGLTGVGLEPLRNSAVLEEIDLSLVGLHESTEIGHEPILSQDVVLPILDSVVDTGALKFIMLPLAWRRCGWRSAWGSHADPQATNLHRFMERFNRHVSESDFDKCSLCNVKCSNAGVGTWRNYVDDPSVVGSISLTPDEWYGLQQNTCHMCKKYFCWDCFGEDLLLPDERPLYSCDSCERNYCYLCRETDFFDLSFNCCVCTSCASTYGDQSSSAVELYRKRQAASAVTIQSAFRMYLEKRGWESKTPQSIDAFSVELQAACASRGLGVA